MAADPSPEQIASAYSEVTAAIAASKAAAAAGAAPGSPPAEAPATPAPVIGAEVLPVAQFGSAIDQLRLFGLSERDAAALAIGKPVSVLPAQREEARVLKERLMADPEFVAAYLAGGHKEQAQMMAINLRLIAEPAGQS
jgi:hypothetical protein